MLICHSLLLTMAARRMRRSRLPQRKTDCRGVCGVRGLIIVISLSVFGPILAACASVLD